MYVLLEKGREAVPSDIRLCWYLTTECDENDLELFIDFYNEVYQRQFNIRDNITLSQCSEILFAVIVYRTISNELYQSQAVWRLCESLIAVQIPLDWKLIPLLNSLTKCQEETRSRKRIQRSRQSISCSAGWSDAELPENSTEETYRPI